MEIIQRLRSTAKALLVQLELHGRLAKVEWEQEKNRLQHLFITILIGFACLICVLLTVGFLVVALTWATEYRLLAIGALILFYTIGLALCCYHLSTLAEKSSGTFSATREELAADIALLRGQL